MDQDEDTQRAQDLGTMQGEMWNLTQQVAMAVRLLKQHPDPYMIELVLPDLEQANTRAQAVNARTTKHAEERAATAVARIQAYLAENPGIRA